MRPLLLLRNFLAKLLIYGREGLVVAPYDIMLSFIAPGGKAIHVAELSMDILAAFVRQDGHIFVRLKHIC